MISIVWHCTCNFAASLIPKNIHFEIVCSKIACWYRTGSDIEALPKVKWNKGLIECFWKSKCLSKNQYKSHSVTQSVSQFTVKRYIWLWAAFKWTIKDSKIIKQTKVVLAPEKSILTLSGSNGSFIGYAPGCKFKENNIKWNAEETQPPDYSYIAIENRYSSDSNIIIEAFPWTCLDTHGPALKKV